MQDLKICKVCRSDESDGPLFYPCACKGSIRYVHDKCLQTWISHSKSTSCEVCKCTYKFAPLYKSGTPNVLSFTDLFLGIFKMMIKIVKKIFRLLLIALCWGGFVPFMTSRVYYFFLDKSVPLTGTQFITDIAAGFIGTALMLGGLMALVFLADFLGSLNLTERFLLDHEHVPVDALILDEAARGADDLPNEAPLNDPEPLEHEQQADVVERGDGVANGEEEAIAEPQQQRVEPVVANPRDDNGEANANADAVANGEVANPVVPEEAIHQPAQQQQRAPNENDNVLNFDDALFGFLNIVNQRDRDEAQDVQGLDFVFGLRRPISKMILCAFTVIFLNASLMSVFVLLPTFAGKLVKRYVGEDRLALSSVTNWDLEITVILGYFIIIFMVTFYLLAATLKQRYFGNISNNEKVFIGIIIFFYTAVKVGILNFIEIAIFPLFNSYLIMLSVQPLFHSTEVDLNYIRSNIFFCWMVGAFFNALLGLFIRHLRGFLRKDVLWMFRNTNDPGESLIREIIKSSFVHYLLILCKSAVKYFITIFVLVYIPVRIIDLLFAPLFPLNLLQVKPIDEDMGLFDIAFFHLFVPVNLKIFQPLNVLGKMCKSWVLAVGVHFGIGEYLFGPPDNARQADESIELPDQFALRIASFLGLSWLAYLLFTIAMFPIPLYIGRIALSGFDFSDLYATVAGLYVVCGSAFGLYKIVNFYYKGEATTMQQVTEWATILGKIVIVGFYWFGVIPAMLAVIFFEVMYVPLRVDANQSPAKTPMKLYPFAVLTLNFWYRFVMLLDAPSGFRQKFQKVHDNGWQINLGETFTDIFIPIVSKLLVLICLPYVVNKTILPYLVPDASQWEIYTPLIIVKLIMSYYTLLETKTQAIALHQYIKDKKYLVGNQLQNASDEPESNEAQQQEQEQQQEAV